MAYCSIFLYGNCRSRGLFGIRVVFSSMDVRPVSGCWQDIMRALYGGAVSRVFQESSSDFHVKSLLVSFVQEYAVFLKWSVCMGPLAQSSSAR